MNTTVTALTITQVDWSAYQGAFQSAFDSNPAARLDANQMQTGDLNSYLATLDPLIVDPRQAMRESSIILKHAHAGFLTDCPIESVADIMSHGIHCTIHGDYRNSLTVMTGSILDWKNTCIALSTKDAKPDARYTVNQCMFLLERAGLRELFGRYSKVAHSDKTFLLRAK